MTDLFSFAEAKARRDVGMARAANAQGPLWCDVAYQAIEEIARRQMHVHIDDVLSAGVPDPEHHNAWGAVWSRAIKLEIIQRTNQTKLCTTDKRKHAHRYPIYFSRIFKGAGNAV